MISQAINSVIQTMNRHEQPRKLNSLALFRILFFSHVLFTIYFTQVYKGLIFDSIAGITKNPFPFNTFLSIWAVSAFCMLIGLGSRIASVLNYACVVIAYELFWRSGVLSYYDDLLLMGSFLCIFLPVSGVFSFDAPLKRLITGNTKPAVTSQLVYVAFIILSLGLMYVASGLTKMVSPIWQKGIGLWIPMSMPFFKWNMLPGYIADYEWLLKILNYVTIVWEVFFLMMMLNKKLRVVAIVAGIFFHIGIGLFFHFPMEALGTLVFYALFVPDSFWQAFSNRLNDSNKIKVVVPAGNSTAIRSWAVLKSLDYRNRFAEAESLEGGLLTLSSPAIFIKLLSTYTLYKPIGWLLQSGAHHGVQKFVKDALTTRVVVEPKQVLSTSFKRSLLIHFVLFVSLVQCYLSARHVVRKLVGRHQTHAAITTPEAYNPPPKTLNPSWLTRSLFGINGRGLFLDNALSITRTVYSISYTDKHSQQTISFPFANDKGNVVNDIHFDGTATRPYAHYLQKGNTLSVAGLEKVLRFRFSKERQPYTDLRFCVLSRTYVPPTQFEVGYWRKMEVLPWDTVGTAYWQNDTFRYVPHIKASFSAK